MDALQGSDITIGIPKNLGTPYNDFRKYYGRFAPLFDVNNGKYV